MTLTRLRPLAALMLVAMLGTTACKSDTGDIAVDANNDANNSEIETIVQDDTQDANTANLYPDTGESTAGNYRNDYFGFSMGFPQDWSVASQETTDELQDLGSDLVAGDDDTLKSSLEAAEKNTYQLLMVSAKPIGAPVETFNPNIVVMAEKVSHLPGIKSGEEYLTNVSNLLQQTELPYEAEGTPYEVDINGQTFHRADFILNAGGLSIKQSYLAKIDKGYALGFILSSTDDTSNQLDEITNSIQF